MFLPIPSLMNKYEIDERGKVRNAKTKKILKPLKRTKGGRRYRFCFEGKKIERTIAQLLFEVHGKNPPRGLLPAVPVTVIKDAERKFFTSLTSAAKFLHTKIFYGQHSITQLLSSRPPEFCGYQFIYHEPQKRFFRSVEKLLGEKYLRREDDYWSKQNE